MKFRYYMRGFGAGLIVAVIVLMIAGRIQKNNNDYAAVSGNKETVTATEKQSEESTTTRPVVSITSGNGDEGTEIVFSGVYTAAQAADILFDAGIISDKTEFYTYMYTSGYDRKMKDGTYHLKAGDSYETIAKTITQSK